MERNAVENPQKKIDKHPLWKTKNFHQTCCGKKAVVSQRKTLLFHINFLYYYFYYLFYEL